MSNNTTFTGTELAELLKRVPAMALPHLPRQQLTPLLRDMLNGRLTCQDGIEHMDSLVAALQAAHVSHTSLPQEGAALCRTLDELPAVAAPAPAAW